MALTKLNDIATLFTDDELENETPETLARAIPPRYELPKVSEGYVMSEEPTRDILACNDRDDLEKLLCKYKEKSLNASMKCDLSLLLHLSVLLIRIMISLSILS